MKCLCLKGRAKVINTEEDKQLKKLHGLSDM